MTISNRNKKYKRSGSILASVMVAAIVWIMIAQSMFITFSGQFKMISSSRTALQAQQYAEIALDKLKNINYDELDSSGAHSRKKIEGISSDDWQDEVTIGAESPIAGSDDAKQRIATVNVYKVGDTLPRYTVELPLSSQGNNVIGAPEEGSVKLQNKLIIKYGTYTHSNGEYAEIFYFPTPFPHKCVSIVGSPDTYHNELNWSFIKRDRTSFYMYMDNGGHYTFSWIAIGY